MRLSKFQTKVIWLIGLIAFVVIAFKLEPKEICINQSMLLFKILSISFLFMWSVGLSETLQEIVALKYRITEEKQNVTVEYLTFWWIVPYWESIDKDCNGYEVQNLFGATWNEFFTIDVTYKNRKEAILAIEKHKAKVKKNRKDWFEIPKPQAKKVSYM